MTSIGRRMAHGAAWMVAARLADKLLGLISTLVLARLLVPEDFGLVAMAMAFVALLHVMTNFSFDYVLIQHQAPDRTHYDTVWTIGLMFGVGIAVALVLLAAPAAEFYREPRLVDVMYIVAATATVGALVNVGCVDFRRDLRFHKDFQLGLYRRLASLPLTIGLALWLRDYRALLFGALGSAAFGVAISYAMHPFRPRLSLAHRDELFGFSKWLLVNNLLNFLNTRTADFLIGRFRGPHELGLFSLANEVAMLPSTEFVAPINRAAFPGYSRIAERLDEVSRTYLRVIGAIALTVLPASIGLALTAHYLVPLLFGAKWSEAVPVFRLLAIASAFFALWTNTSYVMMALGRPERATVVSGCQAASTVIALLAFLTFDVQHGVGWAILLTAIGSTLPNMYLWRTELHLRVGHLVRQIWRPLVGCTVMAIVVLSLQAEIEGASGAASLLPGLLASVVVGALAYAGSVYFLWRLARQPVGAESFVLGLVQERLGAR